MSYYEYYCLRIFEMKVDHFFYSVVMKTFFEHQFSFDCRTKFTWYFIIQLVWFSQTWFILYSFILYVSPRYLKCQFIGRLLVHFALKRNKKKSIWNIFAKCNCISSNSRESWWDLKSVCKTTLFLVNKRE